MEPWIPGWLQITLSLLVIAISLVYYYFTNTFNYWKHKNVKYVKAYPVVGSIGPILTFTEHMLHFHQRIYNQYLGQPYVGVFLGKKPSLIVLDPEIVKNIFVKDFQHFVDHGFLIDERVDPLDAKTLFTLEGHRWKEMRAKLTAIFTSGRMKSMFPLLLNVTRQLEEQIEQHGALFEAKDLYSRFAIDVIGSCVFGIECNVLNNPNCEFHKMAKKFVLPTMGRALSLLFITFLPEMCHKLGIALIDKATTEFFRSLVRNVIEHRTTSGETRNDFMQVLIELKENGRLADDLQDNDGPVSNPENGELYANFPHSQNFTKWTHDDVTAQALIMLFVGNEATSSVISFSLLEIASSPEIQRKAQHEIDEVLQRHENIITYQALQEMHYLDCILKESMRKYPPVLITQRTCNRNYIIPSTKLAVEKDTMMIIPIHAIQNDPRHFPDPHIFKPERFSTPYDRNKFLYMPFGEGPRMCLGDRFAMMQSKLALIATLRKFNVTLSSKTDNPPTYDNIQYFLNTKNGIWLKVIPRHT